MNQTTIKRTQPMDMHKDWHNGRHSKGTINIGKPAAASNVKRHSAEHLVKGWIKHTKRQGEIYSIGTDIQHSTNRCHLMGKGSNTRWNKYGSTIIIEKEWREKLTIEDRNIRKEKNVQEGVRRQNPKSLWEGRPRRRKVRALKSLVINVVRKDIIERVAQGVLFC